MFVPKNRRPITDYSPIAAKVSRTNLKNDYQKPTCGPNFISAPKSTESLNTSRNFKPLWKDRSEMN